jgi:MarR family transcriptional regulator, lower aerobic nicotinate degradation pathway regulator
VDISLPDVGPTANCMPAELLASSAFLLVRMGYAVKARATEEFERAGFSPPHYSVLALLEEGARDTQSAIADALQLDRSQLVGLLDALEEHGLVERRRDAGDRRRHVVTLTAAGRRQLIAFRTIVSGLEREFLAPLGEPEQALLHGLLSQLAAGLDPRYAPERAAAAG